MSESILSFFKKSDANSDECVNNSSDANVNSVNNVNINDRGNSVNNNSRPQVNISQYRPPIGYEFPKTIIGN